MSAIGVFDIRRIVEQAQDLEEVPVPASEHPIGLRIKQKHSLVPGEGQPRLRLPKRLAGLTNLQTVVAQSVLDLKPSEAAIAWRLLLDQPSLCATLRPPTDVDLLEAGSAVPSSSTQFVRSAALAVVCSRIGSGQSQAEAQAPIVADRFAAVGRLIVLTDEKNPSVSVDAWADIRWVRSTQALSRELEKLYKDAIPAVQTAGSRASATLLLGDDLADAIEPAADETEAALSRIAAVHGFDLSVLRRPTRFAGDVIQAIRRRPPSLFLIAAQQIPVIETITAEYISSATKPRASRLGNPLPDELLIDFRESLAAATGINPALFQASPHPEIPGTDEEVPRIGLYIPSVWPVENFGRKMVHETHGLFVENTEDGLWYTRDRAHHANSIVKRYRLVSRQFIHDADIDVDGKVIPKHKGAASAIINFEEFRGV